MCTGGHTLAPWLCADSWLCRQAGHWLNWSVQAAKPHDTGCQWVDIVRTITCIWLLRFPHVQSRRIHTGPTGSIAVVTHLQSALRGVQGGNYIVTQCHLSCPVIAGRHPQAETLLNRPFAAFKCWEFSPSRLMNSTWWEGHYKCVSCIVVTSIITTANIQYPWIYTLQGVPHLEISCCEKYCLAYLFSLLKLLITATSQEFTTP